jgi:hydrophobe/amphiphile efflux-1 (HAE1) family protein
VSFSEIFIRRPIATALLAIALFIAGAAAYVRLPVSPLPRVDFPTIQVNARLPGASPETMASAVATPLERRFGRIAGVSEMTSSSSLGMTQITLLFDLDRDIDAAARDVQAAINAAGGELPANLPTRPTYRKTNPSDAPILILSITSETLPLPQVFDIANSVIAQKISQMEGVGEVHVGGGQQPAVRVAIDPGAIATLGLTFEDVRAAIARTTTLSPKGSLSGARESITIAANDQLFGARAFEPTIISYKDGAAVRLRDVAKVTEDLENNRVAAWTNGKRSVVLIVRRQPGANILETIDRVVAILPMLSRSISPAIDITVALDRAQTIRASVHDVERTLVLSVGLVVMVVFLFLRSFKVTVIPSVVVPLSLVGTFGVMYLCGYSLDNLSLMALTISTGFVVDDAIVVTENVTRLAEAGEPPLQAAIKGAKQIGFTIVSITASLLAVFIPILLMGGIIGRLFRELAVTLSVAIAVSAIISLTLTPMMCARLVVHEPTAKRGRFALASERILARMVELYDRQLRWVLDHQRLMLGVTLGMVALTVVLFVEIPKGLFPQQDTGTISGFSDAAQDTSFTAMRERQEKLNAIVRQDPDIAGFVAFTSDGNTGRMFAQLRADPDRPPADVIIGRLRPKLMSVPGIALYLQSVQDVRMGGRPTRTQYQYALEDANLAELRLWAPRVLEALKALPELRDVASDLQTAGQKVTLDIDRDTASRLGVRLSELDNTLYDAFGQRQIATMYTQTNQYRVVIEMADPRAGTPGGIDELYVRSQTGAAVPIRTFTQRSVGMSPLSIAHQGQFPAVTLSFNLAPGVALGQAVEAIHAAELRIGLPSNVHASFQGTAKAFRASLDSQPILILAALLAVYIVLGVLYESTIHPITILSTLPSAGVGALLALLLTGTELSIIALIGIILLIGIVKKNAIMMIDFALELTRDAGLSPREAIHQACLLRVRPIMMTTLAALLGGLPLALGSGIGSELRRPLGIAIVGGLVVSQALTLFTTPVIYLALDRFSSKRPRHAEDASPSLLTDKAPYAP